MAELKTKATSASVSAFLDRITDDQTRRDCKELAAMMKRASGAGPKMWGPAIVGFGDRHLVYDSGRELDWFMIGFSPRKGNLALYLMGGLDPLGDLLGHLGKHKTGKGCLYIRSLADVDKSVLTRILARACKGRAKKRE